jgi:hypothetical protein
MTRLLLVEPDKMLRHAFMVALYPDFQVECSEALPNTTPKDYDAVIVDAVALQAREPESARALHTIQEWHLPVIWIEDGQATQAAPVDRCFRLIRPVAKAALRLALAQYLSPSSAPSRQDSASGAAPKSAGRAKRKAPQPVDDAPSAGNFIELVDVVEEETAS